MTDPEKEIQGILDGAKQEGFLSPRQVDGQVVELLSFGHHLAATAQWRGDRIQLMLQRRTVHHGGVAAVGKEAEPSPFAQDRVLDFKLHVDRHGTRVDARRVRLVTRLRLGHRHLTSVARRRGRQGGRDAFTRQTLVHFLHVVLQLVQTLAEELVGVLASHGDTHVPAG